VREITLGLTALALLWAALGCAAWWSLAKRGRPWLGVVMGVTAIGGLALRTLLVWDFLGLGRFGEIHGVYLAAVLSIPILGAFVTVTSLLRWPDGRRRAALALTGTSLAVVPAALGIYATHIGPFQLRVQTVHATVGPERSGQATIRIAVLSDIQTTAVGDHERAAVRAAMATQPDIVLIPGDILQGTDEQNRAAAPQMKALLEQLRAPGGVFVVGGDVERTRNIDAVRPDSMVLLEDEVAVTTVRDRTVAIGGTLIDYDAPGALAVKDELMSQPTGTVRVLLSHRPDTVLSLAPGSEVDLTVAGHTHGGQVAVPFIGPLMTLTDVPRSVAAGGLHYVHGNQIYVSPGVGMERGRAPQIRFGVPPTVGIIDLG
jgi:predicted MPP superfamily phosphohydrolase